MNESLDAIGIRTGTDKSSKRHNYLNFYERSLAPLRDESFFLFEIGVFHGSSLQMWGDYFKNAKVVGMDINPLAEGYKIESQANTFVRIGDSGRLEEFDKICAEFGRPRVVIDDGSHLWHHQIEAIRYMWPRVEPGGFFIMEDIHTSFPTLAAEYKGYSSISCYDYMLKLNRWVTGYTYMAPEEPDDGFIANYAGTIESINWFKGTCIMQKKIDV